MARLIGSILADDDAFKRHIAALLRAGAVPINLSGDPMGHDGAAADLVIVDARGEMSSAMIAVERMRATTPTVGIFVVADTNQPDAILQAMRAGANEFFAWAAGDVQVSRSVEEAFHGALRRAAARREAAQAGAKRPSETLVFFGAKGGAGTTTVSVNCAVELARLTKRPTVIVDLKQCLGEVALFLGVRPRFTLLDAIENLHRLDRDFLKELVAKHKSGLDILAGSEQFDRPGAQDAGAVEELFRVLPRIYDFVVVDAGNLINACTVAALYTADHIFLVANPDVPSIRNAQRLVDRVRQLGAGSERVRVLLNRVSDQHLIAPKQIETALGYAIHHSFSSDYRTVSSALNSGVPLSLANHSEIAEQFDRFTRMLIGPAAGAPVEADAKRRGHFLGLF